MKIKLMMISISYKENAEKKTVTAIVKTKSLIGFSKKTLTTVGVAKCDDKDTYDVEKGKRIARAKAEKEAYILHKQRLHEWLKFIDRLRKQAVDSHWKIGRYIEHQKEYIKSF